MTCNFSDSKAVQRSLRVNGHRPGCGVVVSELCTRCGGGGKQCVYHPGEFLVSKIKEIRVKRKVKPPPVYAPHVAQAARSAALVAEVERKFEALIPEDVSPLFYSSE